LKVADIALNGENIEPAADLDDVRIFDALGVTNPNITGGESMNL
jgi:hypothetical protein